MEKDHLLAITREKAVRVLSFLVLPFMELPRLGSETRDMATEALMNLLEKDSLNNSALVGEKL